MSILSIGSDRVPEGEENLNIDRRPNKSGFHPVGLYRTMYAELIRRLGYVTDARGHRYPRLSYDEALTLILYWQRIGREIAAKSRMIDPIFVPSGATNPCRTWSDSYFMKDGRCYMVNSVSAGWAKKVQAENNKFSQYFALWTTNWLVRGTVANDPKTRMPAEASIQLFKGPMGFASGLTRYAITLDTLMWASFNVDVPTIWGGIKHAVKASGKVITNTFVEAMNVASASWTLTKLALYGTIAAAGLWAISYFAKEGRKNVTR